MQCFQDWSDEDWYEYSCREAKRLGLPPPNKPGEHSAGVPLSQFMDFMKEVPFGTRR